MADGIGAQEIADKIGVSIERTRDLLRFLEEIDAVTVTAVSPTEGARGGKKKLYAFKAHCIGLLSAKLAALPFNGAAMNVSVTIGGDADLPSLDDDDELPAI